MIRSLPWILAGAITVSGCGGPIETRIETHQAIAAPEQKKFTVSPINESINGDLVQASDMVAKALGKKGYQLASDAPILVHVALSERPADIAVNAGATDSEQSLSAAKTRKRFQSCKDSEQRLTVSLFDQVQGAMLYSGKASEHHCKGTITQSLPFLVDAALSGLGENPTNDGRSAIRTRQGIE